MNFDLILKKLMSLSEESEVEVSMQTGKKTLIFVKITDIARDLSTIYTIGSEDQN